MKLLVELKSKKVLISAGTSLSITNEIKMLFDNQDSNVIFEHVFFKGALLKKIYVSLFMENEAIRLHSMKFAVSKIKTMSSIKTVLVIKDTEARSIKFTKKTIVHFKLKPTEITHQHSTSVSIAV